VLADLGHIARASGVAMQLHAEQVPVAATLSALCAPAQALQLALTAGDDYELVFTAPASKRAEVHAAGFNTLTRLTRIGKICAEGGLTLLDTDGQPMTHDFVSFDHFA
jgi:thiamine-monophosphate kinase